MTVSVRSCKGIFLFYYAWLMYVCIWILNDLAKTRIFHLFIKFILQLEGNIWGRQVLQLRPGRLLRQRPHLRPQEPRDVRHIRRVHRWTLKVTHRVHANKKVASSVLISKIWLHTIKHYFRYIIDLHYKQHIKIFWDDVYLYNRTSSHTHIQ